VYGYRRRASVGADTTIIGRAQAEYRCNPRLADP
jgi:hypothetical protein